MKRDPASLDNKAFDLLICGGGIYGAWSAYDAALRGLRVALVEKGDWASGTSSASSKLIHGGLRYLETYDFRLVRKALKERQRLLRIAPHRVWPLNFGVPVYDDSRVGTLQLAAGLTLYDLLAGDLRADMHHRHFSRNEFGERFANLDTTGLHGGFTYADAQTDDARLALELVAGALKAGAACVNYCELDTLEGSAGQYTARLTDKTGGASLQIRASQVAVTAGQWISSAERQWCRLTKGVHLVLPATQCEDALLLTAKSDGRVFFMIPWYGTTLVGTTDTDFAGDINNVAVESGDVAYLLNAANRYLKTQWTTSDILGAFAGVRVMKHNEQDNPSDVSRDWELRTSANGVLYSVGGKITSARTDASQLVDRVCENLGLTARCGTGDRPFPWAPEEAFDEWSPRAQAHAIKLGVDAECALWLVRRHGRRVYDIFERIEAEAQLAGRIVPSLPFIHADLHHAASTEMVVHLGDLLRRRMPLLILARLGLDDLSRCATAVAATLGWDEKTVEREISACLK